MPWLTFPSFGFAKYYKIRDSEHCIRGFYMLGYEVGFARVCLLCHLNTRSCSDPSQESFNSRLKAEGDDNSTNLYVSNLPKNMTESVRLPNYFDLSYAYQSHRNSVPSSWTIL